MKAKRQLFRNPNHLLCDDTLSYSARRVGAALYSHPNRLGQCIHLAKLHKPAPFFKPEIRFPPLNPAGIAVAHAACPLWNAAHLRQALVAHAQGSEVVAADLTVTATSGPQAS